MGYLDDALAAMPGPDDDVAVELPARTARSDGSGAATSPASAPEPAPQQQDPDEGEHTDDRPPADEEPEESVDEVDEPESELVAEDGGEAADEDASVVVEVPTQEKDTLRNIVGRNPAQLDSRSAASHRGETTTLKKFPAELVKDLRVLAAAETGGDFAAAVSSRSVVAAFVASRLGASFDLDPNAEALVTAFRALDPQASKLEDLGTQSADGIKALQVEVRAMSHRIEELDSTVAGAELAAAYVITDRAVGLDTDGLTEGTVRVDDPKVLTVLERVRLAVQAQRSLAKGRRDRRAK